MESDSDYDPEVKRRRSASNQSRQHKAKVGHSSPLSVEDSPASFPINDPDEKPDDSTQNTSEGSSSSSEEEDSILLKRSAEEDLIPDTPFKRLDRGFTTSYLDLLNAEIQSAALRVHHVPEGGHTYLEVGQVGLTTWTTAEKQVLYQTITRFGRHNGRRIALEIGTKSEVEVFHYLKLLKRATEQRRQQGIREVLALAAHPAALEIGQQCFHAQEEAADTISLRQEYLEQEREMDKWGDDWNVTPKLAKKLPSRACHSEAVQKRLPMFGQLFHTSKWLRLSNQIFMNSNIPSNNWHFMSEDPPTVWATAFEDFHSLAISFTRRLVETVLFVTSSRIRARNDVRLASSFIVRSQDVEAAVSSLGLSRNSHQFWKQGARRLRLEVVDDHEDNSQQEVEEAMDYDEVERALAVGETSSLCGELGELGVRSNDQAMSSATISNQPRSSVSSDQSEFGSSRDDDGDDEDDLSKSEFIIDEEEREVVHCTTSNFLADRDTRLELRKYLRAEHQRESEASKLDECASRNAELEMWETLQRPPPADMPRLPTPDMPRGQYPRLPRALPADGDWSDKMRHYNDWETLGGRQPGWS